MASKGREKASLFTLSRERWTQEDHSAIALELSEGSDRAAAIVGASITETALEDAVHHNFRLMKKAEQKSIFSDPTAPLSSKSLLGTLFLYMEQRFEMSLIKFGL